MDPSPMLPHGPSHPQVAGCGPRRVGRRVGELRGQVGEAAFDPSRKYPLSGSTCRDSAPDFWECEENHIVQEALMFVTKLSQAIESQSGRFTDDLMGPPKGRKFRCLASGSAYSQCTYTHVTSVTTVINCHHDYS